MLILSDNYVKEIPEDYDLRYLPAMLRANDGRITNAVARSNLMNICVICESGVFGPPAVSTTHMPKIPNTMEAQINTHVAIFCI